MAKKYNVSLKLTVNAGHKTEEIQEKVEKLFSMIFSNAFYTVKNTVEISIAEDFTYTLVSMSKKEQLSKDKLKNKNFEDFLVNISKDLNKSLNSFDARVFTLSQISFAGEDNENYFTSYDTKRRMKKMGSYTESFEESVSDIIIEIGGVIDSGEKVKKKDLPFHRDFIMNLYYSFSEGSLGFIFIGNKVMLFNTHMGNNITEFYYISPDLEPSRAGALFLKKLYEDWES